MWKICINLYIEEHQDEPSEPTEIPPEILFPTEAIEGESDAAGQGEDIDDDSSNEHYDNKFDELPNSKGCGSWKQYSGKDDDDLDEHNRESKIGEHPWVVLIPCEGSKLIKNHNSGYRG